MKKKQQQQQRHSKKPLTKKELKLAQKQEKENQRRAIKLSTEPTPWAVADERREADVAEARSRLRANRTEAGEGEEEADMGGGIGGSSSSAPRGKKKALSEQERDLFDAPDSEDARILEAATAAFALWPVPMRRAVDAGLGNAYERVDALWKAATERMQRLQQKGGLDCPVRARAEPRRETQGRERQG